MQLYELGFLGRVVEFSGAWSQIWLSIIVTEHVNTHAVPGSEDICGSAR